MRLFALLLLPSLTLACAPAEAPAPDLSPGAGATGEKTYGDLPFWDGDTCVEIRPDGRRMVVPQAKCPPKG